MGKCYIVGEKYQRIGTMQTPVKMDETPVKTPVKLPHTRTTRAR